jgi:hypothetical protein
MIAKQILLGLASHVDRDMKLDSWPLQPMQAIRSSPYAVASLKCPESYPNAASGRNQKVRQAFQPDLVSLERLTYN